MKSFDDASEIFADSDILQKDYTPSELPEREDELNELHSVLLPATRGSTPLNAFLYGKTGQGKTAAVNLKTQQLLEYVDEKEDLELTVVTIRCNSLSKSYHVAAQLVKELRGPGAEKPRGYEQQDLFEMLFEELNDIGGTIIVVLDEIDSIGRDDDLLYELPRAGHNGYLNEDVKLSVIGISNDFQFRENLRPKVKDTLCDDEIEFAPYDATQLQAILNRRAEKALLPDVLADDVVPLCSAIAAQDKGSARQAIKYLYKACRMAEDAGDDFVTVEHVRSAQEQIEREFVQQGLRNLTTQDHLALAAVTALSIDGETPARTRDIYLSYQSIAQSVDADAIVMRRFRDHLRDLELYNVLNYYERNEGYNKGSYYEYELAVPLGMVLDILPTIDRLDTIAESLREKARRANLSSA